MKTKILMSAIAVAVLTGCAHQAPNYVTPAQIQQQDMCRRYAQMTPDFGTTYASCLDKPDLINSKIPEVVARMSPNDLCTMPKPETPITYTINLSIKKRHIDCAKMARDNQIQSIRSSANPELCEAWSDRSGGELQPVVDSEVKKRGVRCELILSQIQQQQIFEAQQQQQQLQFQRQMQMQNQQNLLMQQQIQQQSIPQPVFVNPSRQQNTNCTMLGNTMNCYTN